MQVIDNMSLLAAIGGGEGDEDKKETKDKVTCKIGLREASCEGTVEAWGDLIFSTFDRVQSAGGAMGIWLWDVLHTEGDPGGK